MRRILFTLILATLFAQPALAEACYTPDAAAAEAVVRIHSKLMVIALTCKYAPDGSNLTDAYVAFGKKNNVALRKAEADLITYYRQSGKSGVAELDKLRTVLGNQYATEIATADPTEFCKTAGSAVQQATYWNPPQLQQAVAQQVSGSGMRVCQTHQQQYVTTGTITGIKLGDDAAPPAQ